MKKLEPILGILAVLAIALKFIGIPGSNILIILVLTFLSWSYLLGFLLFNNIRLRQIFKKQSYSGISKKRLIGSVCLGILLSSIIMGSLFKLMFWPGGQLFFSLLLLTPFLVYALVLNAKNQTPFYSGILKRILVIGGLGLATLALPKNTLIDIYHGDDPEYAELMKQTLDDPYNDELREQLNQLRKDRMRKEMNNN